MVIYDAKFADVKPIESKPFTVNAAQMAQINENVFNYFGTNAGILQNKYTEDEWNAYYEGTIEPFAIQLQSKLFKLLRIDSLRCFCHQVRCIFYLRERDHVYREPLTIRKQSNEAEYQHTVI